MAATAHAPPYPPEMPWRLRAPGPVLASLHWVDIGRARAVVPPELSIVPILPGRTIGGLFLAEYGPGSDLEYSELIVGAATVRYGRRICLWVTDLFVDDNASLAGGRSLLGAPKHRAEFTWGEAEVAVRRGSGIVCRVRYRSRMRLWRQRIRMSAMHRDVRDPSGATVVLHGDEMRGRWELARVDVQIPPASPLGRLGFRGPVVGFHGCEVALTLGGAPFLPLQLLSLSPAVTR